MAFPAHAARKMRPTARPLPKSSAIHVRVRLAARTPAETMVRTGRPMALNTPQRPALPKRASSGDPPGATGLLVAAAANPMAFALALFLLAALVDRLALAVGPGDDPLGRQGALPAADPVPGAEPGARASRRLWAPFVFSGHPQIADPQAMIFSPPFLALALMTGAPSLWASGRHRARHGVPGRRGADAVVSRPGLALGRRTDRRAGLQLWRVDGLAHPAYRPGAEPRLLAAWPCCAWTARWRAGRSLYGVAAGLVAACIVLGRDQVALLGDLFAGRARGLAPVDGSRAARRVAGKRAVARGRRACCALAAHRHTGAADGAAGAEIQPCLDRLYRRRARLAASGTAADTGHARPVRRLGPHGGLLGPAEFCLAGYGAVHRPEHGRALYRRGPAPAAVYRRLARAAVGARGPLLHLARRRRAALRARLAHAGVPPVPRRCCRA